MTNFQLVRQFHQAFGHPVETVPKLPDDELQVLRVNLIDEECVELYEALQNGDIVAAADALTDILYVVYGAGLVFGIDLDRTFAEVHRSNMAKLGPDGKPIYRADGKILKPEGWQPPDIAGVLGLNGGDA